MFNVAIFTGTRAEYGLLYWVIKGLHEAPECNMQLMVGGMHLVAKYGNTITQIEQDGFPIAAKLDFLSEDDSPLGIAKAMGKATAQAATFFAAQKPDLLIYLGDRFEGLAVAQAALVANIPIAHIHGGEVTEGAMDEAFRHAISKMSYLHFATTESHLNRVIQLGESPERVFNVGAPGLDTIKRCELMSPDELAESLAFDLKQPYFAITYHPVTLEEDENEPGCAHLLRALDQFPEHQCIITYPNADTHNQRLIEQLNVFQAAQPERVRLVQSLGNIRYLSLVKHAAAVLGNSSSGLLEVPSLGVPTVNIGNRQKGRTAGESVIHCDSSETSIANGIGKAISPEFQALCKQVKNPYGEGEASEKIVQTVLDWKDKLRSMKPFYDLPTQRQA